jgi:hypothetical protein
MDKPPATAAAPTAQVGSGAASVDLAAELAKVLDSPHKAIGTRIKELTYNWSVKGLNVQGNFYYLALQDGKPTVEDFVKVLYHQVPYFCLTRKDRQKHIDAWKSSGELHHMQEMFDKARKLLIRSKDSGKTVGEPRCQRSCQRTV